MKAYERFLQYIAVPSASDETSETCPSTSCQRDFAERLCGEMLRLGIADARVDENGYVYGSIPATVKHPCPVLGFIAHMDVVGDVPSQPVHPRLIPDYDGGPIRLNKTRTTDLADVPVLNRYRGKTLIVTDGNTILGADDKAGIAEILTMAEIFLNNPSLPHGEIRIAFTPDEEIGRGADRFDVAGFGADFAYTLDGAGFGEVEYETFNAYACTVTVHGLSIHPGEAKNRMKNSCEIAMEFHAMLPANEKPQHTDGYEGFYHLTDLAGQVETCTMHYILRDHDAGKIQQRCQTMQRIAAELNARYGEGTVEVEIRESYRNMAEVIRENFHLIDTAFEAVRQLGGTPVSAPVRGGTDGSRLSFMGLPCPNLGTGSHLHHGRQEFACAEDMERCAELAVKIAGLYADPNWKK